MQHVSIGWQTCKSLLLSLFFCVHAAELGVEVMYVMVSSLCLYTDQQMIIVSLGRIVYLERLERLTGNVITSCCLPTVYFALLQPQPPKMYQYSAMLHASLISSQCIDVKLAVLRRPRDRARFFFVMFAQRCSRTLEATHLETLSCWYSSNESADEHSKFDIPVCCKAC